MSSNFASDFYPDTIKKDAVADLLGSNFDDQPLPVSKGQIKRDQDSTDDFEHLEKEFSMRDSRPPNLDFDSNTISKEASNVATKNLLDTTNPVFEQDIRPVPATPPPSANSDETDPFQKEPKILPMDPKTASMAFMESERGHEKDLFESKDDPLGKFDFTSSQSKVDVPSSQSKLLDFTTSEVIKDFTPNIKNDFNLKSNELPDIKKDELPNKPVELSFLKDFDTRTEKKEVKDDEDDSWNLVGKSKFDDAPTKPLPPLPKESQFESFDPYKAANTQEDYEMSREYLLEELQKAKQSGNETGDSEFESEPEPSPAKSVSKVKTDIRQTEEIYRRVPEKKFQPHPEVVAPADILGSLGLVAALIYWRDPKKSGIVFGAILGVLLSLAYFSLISVLAYTSLLTLTGTVIFRIYKAVMQAIQKTSDGHPFKDILDLDLTLPAEKVHEVADVAVANANAALSELRRLFLVEDLVDTLKFGVGLWCLTYLGSWFNGMTLVIMGVVALFTLPKVYETNKTQIDQNLALVQAKINDITAKVKAAIPLGKKAEPTKEE